MRSEIIASKIASQGRNMLKKCIKKADANRIETAHLPDAKLASLLAEAHWQELGARQFSDSGCQ